MRQPIDDPGPDIEAAELSREREARRTCPDDQDVDELDGFTQWSASGDGGHDDFKITPGSGRRRAEFGRPTRTRLREQGATVDRNLPGFVAGYWVDPEDGEGFGFMLIESEEQALQAQPPHFDWSAPGVEMAGVTVRRVAVAIP